MSYNTVQVQTEIAGVMPENGWMYPEHDNQFNWFYECFEIYYEVYQTVCKKFDVAIQAGGHAGIAPKLLSTLFKTVYTFEPNPHSFHCLVNNCQNDNIIKFNTCLGVDKKLVYQYYHGQRNIGVSLFKEPELGIEPTKKIWDVDNVEVPTLVNIPQIRIDDLGLESCDLIHLDIEGSESKAFKGAEETIRKFKPVLIFESMDDIDFLTNLGYKPNQKSWQGDSIWVCS